MPLTWSKDPWDTPIVAIKKKHIIVKLLICISILRIKKKRLNINNKIV